MMKTATLAIAIFVVGFSVILASSRSDDEAADYFVEQAALWMKMAKTNATELDRKALRAVHRLLVAVSKDERLRTSFWRDVRHEKKEIPWQMERLNHQLFNSLQRTCRLL